jgi:hypothetical protein
MKKLLIFPFLVFLLISCYPQPNATPNEERTLDPMLLSMLHRYESGSQPKGNFGVPYPDSIFVEIRATVGDVSICEYLKKMGIVQNISPSTSGPVSCYVKPKHLRLLVNYPYIESVRVVIMPVTN